jgi:hypothetical protein
MRFAPIALAVALLCVPAQSDSASERSFPQSVAQVQSILKNLAGGTAGPLPVLDGFVQSSVTGLDQYQRPYYKYAVTVLPGPSGGSQVRVSAKITAWHTSGAKPGYEVLPSNGRLESDLLDRLQQALNSSSASAVVAKNVTPTPTQPTAQDTQAAIDAPSIQFPKRFESAQPIRSAATDNPGLQREADNLSEILRNQSHPTNLVAVKTERTPVLQTPALNGKVLFLASAEDEFEVIEQNPDWIHVRISGLSRGWVRRSAVELLDGSENPQEATQAAAVENQTTPAGKSFSVSSEEIGNFPGNWAPLKGKTVKILSVQSGAPSGASSGEEKLKFAEEMFQKQTAAATSAGLVVVFDTEDGGMIAATSSSIEQYKRGTISEEAFWKQCYVDPPEVLGSAK